MINKKQRLITSSLIPLSGFVLGAMTLLANPQVTHAQETNDQSLALSQNQNVTGSEYTIQKGDTLWRIATKHNVTVSQLKEWNQLSSDTIGVNQRLLIQAASASGPSTPAPTAPAVTPATPATPASAATPAPAATLANQTPAPASQANASQAGQASTGLSTPSANPSPTVTQTQVSSPSQASYTIQAGDTLSKIARLNGVTVDDLRKWNNIQGSLIFPNQKLVLNPGKVSVATPTTPSPSPVTPSKVTTQQVASQAQPAIREQNNALAATYVIKRGDSLNKIAAAHGVTVAQLREWNNISGSLIHPNQVLKVSANPVSANTNGQTAVNTSTPSPAPIVSNQNQATNPSQADTNTPSPAIAYQVKSGDTLFRIAKANGVTVDQLIQWNNLSNNVIQVNQRLIVFGGGKSGSNTSTGLSNQVNPANPTTANGTPAAAGQTSKGHIMDVPLLLQTDPRWANSTYGNDVSRTIWENGCAIVSLAMVDSYYKGTTTNPEEIAKWAGLRHYVANVGTAWTIFEDFGKTYQYDVQNHKGSIESGLEQVKQGNLGVVSVKSGHFANGGHLMVVRGVDEQGNVYVADPNDNAKRNNSKKGHALQLLKRDALNLWTFSPKQ